MKIYNDYESIKKVLEKKYNIEDYIKVLNKMGDEKSKNILYNRIMLDNTNNPEYTLNMINSMYKETSFISKADRKMYKYINFLQKNKNYNKKIIFFGIGFNKNDKNNLMWEFLTLIGQKTGGLDIESIYNEEYGFEIDSYIKRIKVKNIEDFFNIKIDNNKIFVIINKELDYIEEYLLEKDISKENIFKFDNLISFSRERQYLDETFINFNESEIFVDGGSSDLETSLGFIETVDGKYEKIYAIEPFIPDFNECNKIINEFNIPNIEVINCGLWSENKKMNFNPIGCGSSFIDDEGTEKIECKSIDNILDGKKATIIKMDIEGSENEALIGAKNTIKKYHPLLMICVYHKPNDILEITKTVFGIRDDYKLYLRHYSYTKNETVLYFIPINKDVFKKTNVYSKRI